LSKKPKPDPNWDIKACEALRIKMARFFADKLVGLYRICEEPACRRARRCTVGEAPCIVRYKEQYAHMLPELHKLVADEQVRRGLDSDDDW